MQAGLRVGSALCSCLSTSLQRQSTSASARPHGPLGSRRPALLCHCAPTNDKSSSQQRDAQLHLPAGGGSQGREGEAGLCDRTAGIAQHVEPSQARGQSGRNLVRHSWPATRPLPGCQDSSRLAKAVQATGGWVVVLDHPENHESKAVVEVYKLIRASPWTTNNNGHVIPVACVP